MDDAVDHNYDPSEDEPLIPGLERILAEPNYDAMDNLTLLSTLNIQERQESNENDALLPDLEH